MNNIKDQENLNQKKVLLRLDLNVPFKDGLISDETRINKIIPVLDFLIKKKSLFFYFYTTHQFYFISSIKLLCKD